jgi:predicted peroxiredoxin
VAKYLLIESRSPWESEDVAYFYGLARDLASAGEEVTLFLVQNGVLPVRSGAKYSGLPTNGSRVRVLADDFSLRERAIGAADLRPGVGAAGIDVVVDLLAEGARAVWH